jgi:hypothetical protein
MTPYHDPTGDEMEHKYFCYLADKFEADPSLLENALDTIDLWIGNGHWAVAKLLEWQAIIDAAKNSRPGFQRLMKLLRSDDEKAREMKGFDPFPAVLGEQEKEQFLWTSRH